MKGGALLLGVTAPGLHEPFEVSSEQEEEESEPEQQTPGTPHDDQPQGRAKELSSGKSR